MEDWLDSFERYAMFNNWTEDQQSLALMMFVGGYAKRFCQKQPEDIRADIELLKATLRDAFSSEHQNFLRRQELNARMQGSNEPLEEYIDDIDAKAQKLRLTDNETMQCFMQGLQPDIKEHVILTKPETFSEAVNTARLKNSLRTTKPHSTQEAVNELVSTLSKAFSATNLQSAPKPLPQHQTEGTRDELIQLKNDMQALQSQVSAHKNGMANQRTNERSGSQNFRSHRTTDGRPICNRCGRVGHHGSRCYRARDNSRQCANDTFRTNYRPRNDFRPQQNSTNQSRFPALPNSAGPSQQPSIRYFETEELTPESQQVFPQFKFARRRNDKTKTTKVQPNPYHVTIDGAVNGIATNILIDTGASITAVNSEFWNQLPCGSNELKAEYDTVQTANGDVIKVEGKRNLLFDLGSYYRLI